MVGLNVRGVAPSRDAGRGIGAPTRPQVTFPRASVAQIGTFRAPPARLGPAEFRPCRKPEPLTPNCIRFPRWQVGNLMQFGVVGSSGEGSGGDRADARLGGEAARGLLHLAVAEPGRQRTDRLEPTERWAAGSSSPRGLRLSAHAARSGGRSDGGGACLWSRCGAFALQCRASLGPVWLSWSDRGAAAVGRWSWGVTRVFGCTRRGASMRTK